MWKRSDCIGQILFLNLTSRMLANKALNNGRFPGGIKEERRPPS